MKLFLSIILAIGFSAPSIAQSKQFVPKKGMKKIISLKPTMKVKVGQTLYYSASVHASVGSQVSAWSQHDTIVVLDSIHFAYDDDEKAEMSGGDAATRTFIFKAVQAGKSFIKIEDRFRGEITSLREIEITVIDENAEKVIHTDAKESKITMDTVQLLPFKAKEKIRVGQIVIYSANVHGSVGKSVQVSADNRGAIELIDTEFEYDHVQEPGMTGGDSATKSYIFKGLKVGKTTLTIQEVFRGEITDEFKIVITVLAND